MQPVETQLRVRYAETDQMGIVYHANYLVWMEIGRVEFCRAQGITYRDMEEQDGVLLIVADIHCRYHLPARYDDELTVRTCVAAANPRLLRFRYEIVMRSGGGKLASGETTHVFCNRERKPTRLPRKYWEMFGISQAK